MGEKVHRIDGSPTLVDNLCATCCADVDTAVSLGDSGVDNTPGAVDNRLRRGQPHDRVLLSRRTWRSSSARQSKRLIIAVSPVQVRSPLPEPCLKSVALLPGSRYLPGGATPRTPGVGFAHFRVCKAGVLCPVT